MLSLLDDNAVALLRPGGIVASEHIAAILQKPVEIAPPVGECRGRRLHGPGRLLSRHSLRIGRCWLGAASM